MKKGMLSLSFVLVLVLIPGLSSADDLSCDPLSKKMLKSVSSYEAHKSRQNLSKINDAANELERIGIARQHDSEEADRTGDEKEKELSLLDVEFCYDSGLRGMIYTANELFKNRRYAEAKKIFRHIITSYTGTLWTSYVKQAEFGLEDIRAAESGRKVHSK